MFANVEGHSHRSPLEMSNTSTHSHQTKLECFWSHCFAFEDEMPTMVLIQSQFLTHFQRRMSFAAHGMLITNMLCCKTVCLLRAGVEWKCEIYCLLWRNGAVESLRVEPCQK